MRKILFLDFDGVLHGESDVHLARLPRLEHYLRQMPELEIVISSSWRETDPLETLREHFHVTVRDRISGITPSLDCGYDPGGRQREIEAFLAAAGLDETTADWVALDDVAFFFDDGCPFLVLTDPDRGFGDEEGTALLAWYERAKRSGDGAW